MNISILGSTGSIGTQALSVIEEQGDITVAAISGGRNIALLEEQARKFRPALCAVNDEKLAAELKIKLADTATEVASGQGGLIEIATHPDADMVLSSIVGFAGLVPTYSAILAGKDVALANKEVLVAAGKRFMDAAEEHKVRILPVDSEHCAIFECLQGNAHNKISKIWLTASGGPFHGMSRERLGTVTAADALKHPTWTMGQKITVDSSTLMNKGLEVIEARWLFNVPIDNIEAVIHRESIVHSMVEYADGSVIAQMSPPNMKHPLRYAFTYPNRTPSPDKRLDLFHVKRLTFERPDIDSFACLSLAIEAGKTEGLMPTVLNAANEIAVDKFLRGRSGFLEIGEYVEQKMDMYKKYNKANPTIEEIIEMNDIVRSDEA